MTGNDDLLGRLVKCCAPESQSLDEAAVIAYTLSIFEKSCTRNLSGTGHCRYVARIADRWPRPPRQHDARWDHRRSSDDGDWSTWPIQSGTSAPPLLQAGSGSWERVRHSEVDRVLTIGLARRGIWRGLASRMLSI
jgi:hypothetical protein